MVDSSLQRGEAAAVLAGLRAAVARAHSSGLPKGLFLLFAGSSTLTGEPPSCLQRSAGVGPLERLGEDRVEVVDEVEHALL